MEGKGAQTHLRPGETLSALPISDRSPVLHRLPVLYVHNKQLFATLLVYYLLPLLSVQNKQLLATVYTVSNEGDTK